LQIGAIHIGKDLSKESSHPKDGGQNYRGRSADPPHLQATGGMKIMLSRRCTKAAPQRIKLDKCRECSLAVHCINCKADGKNEQ
jgi:hypothetical protein